MDKLEEMLNLQYLLQRKINGYDIDDQALAVRVANISVNVLAATAELHELLDETSWKPWAKGTWVNVPEAQMELVDTFHFVLNLMLHLGMSADDLYQLYVTKNEINHKRQDEGYDGVKGKCSQCHRDLGQVTLNEVISDVPAPHVIIYCPCGREVGRRPV